MFDLHITCTKDISFIKIDFTDGTSTVGEVKNDEPKNSEPMYNFDKSKNTEQKTYKKVKLPEIKDRNDNVKIADELQNLEI